MMQAFAYRHLVPAQDFHAMVRRGMAFRAPIRVTGEQPLRIPVGRAARFQAQVPVPPNNNAIGKVQYELSDPPPGVRLREPVPAQGGAELVIECDAAKAKPGLKGNLIVTISADRIPPPNASAQAAANRQRVQLGALPAIPFEIVAR